MLQKQKDYWKKQAQNEYVLALNEIEKVKVLEETQKGWTKRVNESSWLLQGAKKDTTVLLEKKNEPSLKEIEEEKAKQRAEKKAQNSLFGKVVRLLSPEKKKRPPQRIRYADLERKEEAAKELIEQDERKNRLEFLIESNARIRVLHRVKNWLHVPRMPTHHTDIKHFADYTPECSDLDYDREKNLRNYDVEPLRRIEEDLKSWEDIMKEENEALKFRVAGRHHHYLGAEHLHPLKMFPTTIDVLLPVGAHPNLIPENVLLPNEEERRRKREQEEELKQKKNKKLTRVRKGQLDMSRAQIRLPLAKEDHEATLSVLDEQIRPHTTGKSKPRFVWRSKEYNDQNSVYDGPHPPVEFASPEKKKVVPIVEEVDDNISGITSVAGTEVRYEIIPDNKSIGSKTKAKGVEEVVAEDLQTYPSQELDYHSDFAMRSAYHSRQSTKGELVPVKMQRHRGVKQLDRFKIKKMNLMSLSEKEHILHLQDRKNHTTEQLKNTCD